ncbi:unnamed protein product [Didymodactylos carnosus]|uniref:Uncharacterized protein n=1 Tax=Didymodactylos carnosus TaxID=1234261 RepID=A0A814AFE8_9BILA|nr:unnamed protein product [Didymodactylos carnosus]CAF1524326.1 unnamed protein product [Didymodactylos carnosus]CAF3693547.1 unnamed protein product [Didymodactylos carnosus]CAF4311076.1 unnamed protein product [Didymodactylos carnosus]
MIIHLGLVTYKEKLNAARDWLVPQNQKQVEQLCGLYMYCRKFIQNFAIIARPLTSCGHERRRAGGIGSIEKCTGGAKLDLSENYFTLKSTGNTLFDLSTIKDDQMKSNRTVHVAKCCTIKPNHCALIPVL